MGKKGVSLEDKRKRMIELLQEKRGVFQLRELESLAPKEKGITAQSVKDVLTELANDGLIESEKVGTSLYFWCFPSQSSNTRKRRLDELTTTTSDTTSAIKRLKTSITQEQRGKEDTPDRQALVERLQTMRQRRQELHQQLAQYKDCDPAAIEEKRQMIGTARDAANRWTDNVMCLRSWMKNRFCCEESVINKQFGIADDFDYVE